MSITPPKLTALEIIAAFKAAMADHGIITDDAIIADGTIHRIHIKGHKKGTLNGAYKLHLDGVPAGYFENFTTGQKHTWKLQGTDHTPPNPAELKRIAAANALRASKRQQAQNKAGQKAAYLWHKTALAPPSHPYLAKKNIKPNSVKISISGALILPLYNQQNQLVNLQFIQPDGSKRFLKNGLKRGCFWWLGDLTTTILIAEGFATAASLYEATGLLTVIAYDAGNLEAIAKIIRQRQPAAKIVICADNDESGTGQTKAEAAALAVDGYVATPPITGDFNDFANSLKGNAHD